MTERTMSQYLRLKNLFLVEMHIVVKRLHLIICGGCIVAISMYLLSYLVEPTYVSDSQFIIGKSGTSTQQMGSLAMLAGLSNKSDGYPSIYNENLIGDLVHSENVLGPLMESTWRSVHQDSIRTSLYAIFGIDSLKLKPNHGYVSKSDMARIQARQRLEKMVQLNKAESGIWTLTVTANDPVLAHDINDSILVMLKRVAEGERFNRETQNRAFIEKRLSVVKAELSDVEMNYVQFQNANKSMIDPNLQRIQNGYIREITLKSAVVAELGKQLELARMDEIKEQTSLRVFALAGMAQYKSSPKRMQLTSIGFFIGIFLSLAVILVRNSEMAS